MKRTYIIPSTTSMMVQSCLVCQITSVRGGDLKLGGGADPGASSPIDPM